MQDSASKQSLKTKDGQIVVFTAQDRSLAEKLVKQLEEDVPEIDSILKKESLSATFEIVPNLAQWASVKDYNCDPGDFITFHLYQPKAAVLSYNEKDYPWEKNSIDTPIESIDDWVNCTVAAYFVLQMN